MAALSGSPLPSFVRPLHCPAPGRLPIVSKFCGLRHAILTGRGGVLPPLVVRDAVADLPDPLHVPPKSHVNGFCSLCRKKDTKCIPLHSAEVQMLKDFDMLPASTPANVSHWFGVLFWLFFTMNQKGNGLQNVSPIDCFPVFRGRRRNFTVEIFFFFCFFVF